MKIYVVRHEDRTQDATFFSPLTSRGIENSKQLSKSFKKIGIDLIFSSPFIRTLQTVSNYATEENISIKIDYALVESINPYIIPENSYNVSLPEYLAEMFGVDLQYKPVMSPSDIIWDEKVKNIQDRAKKFLRKIFINYAKTNKTILICTHQAVINCIIKIFNKNHNLEYNYPKGGISKIFDTSKWDFEPINWKYNL